MENVEVIKDELNQHPIPTLWRPTFTSIVKAIADGHFNSLTNISNVIPITDTSVKQICEYIENYGENLVQLPNESWDTSVCLWVGNRWEVLIDLWTEQGQSDLVLGVTVYEKNPGYKFNIDLMYVP